jgi:excisionase family DNA binding protein
MPLFPPEDLSLKLGLEVAVLAARLGVPVSFIRAEIKRGRLTSVRVGRRRLVMCSEIERYLADIVMSGGVDSDAAT